jgi:LEA14-like dessication related protein
LFQRPAAAHVGGRSGSGYTGTVNLKTCHEDRRIAAVLFLVALLSGCATKPLPKCPGLSAVLEAEGPVYLDQFRVSLPFSLSLRNPGAGPARVEAFEARLEVAGAMSEIETGLADGLVVEGGETRCLSFSAPLDMRRYGPAAAAGIAAPDAAPASVTWACEGLARIRLADGSAEEIRVASKGSVVPVREPEFRILSIRIERDLLVTTNLKLMLEIRNPNAFPVTLDGLDWELAGEGRFWAGGRSEEELEVPAGGVASRGIAFEMNFANMDRKLFDLVAKLREVRYRFSGKATIASGREGIPAFVTAFDEAGSCAVER